MDLFLQSASSLTESRRQENEMLEMSVSEEDYWIRAVGGVLNKHIINLLNLTCINKLCDLLCIQFDHQSNQNSLWYKTTMK